MKLFFKSGKIRLLLLALLIFGTLWGWRYTRTPPGGAEWLSGPVPPRPSRLAFLGSWIWPVKRQLSRLKQSILGAPRIVDLRGTIIEFVPSALEPELPALTMALTNRAGAKIFIVTSDAKEFEERLRKTTGIGVLSRPRMTVGDGMQAQMASYMSMALGRGTNLTPHNVGWWLEALPVVRAESVELNCFLTGTERAFRRVNADDRVVSDETFLRTNVAFGARVQVPTNGSLLMIASGTNQNGKVIGALLTPTVQAR
ncbi:MAG TPA: hypothetical protein VNT99_06710 [Methylomirabilota bacterium]|nr:hypothetical protein [Methylomirabilota bacterium]